MRLASAISVLTAALVVGTLVPAQAGEVVHTGTPSASPSAVTPNVCDGKVNTFARVGPWMVAAGKFTKVRPAGEKCSSANPPLTRTNIVIFDATTGAISAVAPGSNGEVYEVLPTGDASTVFVAGAFSKINGAARTGRVAQLDVETGQTLTSFRPPSLNGRVDEIGLANGRLYAGGQFTTVGGVPNPNLVALNPATGARDPQVNLAFAGVWAGGTTTVNHFSITPDGSTLLAIGNFRSVDGEERPQAARLNLSGETATLDDWSTDRFTTQCASVFDTYMRGIDISPDGSYWAITTTGAFAGGASSGTLCDTVSRWEVDPDGPNQQPSWVNYSGGDTFYAVEAAGDVVYVGGHMRWLNNAFAGDAAGPGAVPREGVAALDARNGIPLSWNPGRSRGVGLFDFLATDGGLWMGSDTTSFGGKYRGRIAYTPLAGGTHLPADKTGSLPGDVVTLGKPASAFSPVLYRVNAAGPTLAATDNGPDWAADNEGESALHNNVSTAADWGSTSIGRDDSVPSTTPQAVFSTERWDPGSPDDGSEMAWSFPVDDGLPVQVRLYFSNGYDGTAQAGQRVFDVQLEDETVLTDFDISGSEGHLVGTMREFDVVSDGSIDLTFLHGVENPLINGIEIVRTDQTADAPDGAEDQVLSRTFDGTDAGVPTELDADGIEWRNARAAFMVDGTLYTAWSNGTLTARSFDGSSFGSASTVNLYGLSEFANELPNMTSAFFDPDLGRIYYTLIGQNTLFYRYFTPESRIVGAVRMEAATGAEGLDYRSVRGAFLTDDELYLGKDNGDLRRATWTGSAPDAGTLDTVSGRDEDGQDWRSRAMFLSVQ